MYSSQVELLLEPVVRYMWDNAWITPDTDSVLRFLMGTIRMALPEGLLGFFKASGELSSESVLGRLGFAAALAYITEMGESQQLVVSLDTEGARRWLGLREGKERRADLVVFKLGPDASWDVEAIEVKARTDSFSWTNSPPEAVVTALDQVREMQDLLLQIFGKTEGNPFTSSRREILKRQVFLEAFQQWEHIRVSDEGRYTEWIARLNKLFEGEVEAISKKVLLINPGFEGDAEIQNVVDAGDETPVVTLGVPWLKRVIDSNPESGIEISTELLDEFLLDIKGKSEEPDRVTAPSNHVREELVESPYVDDGLSRQVETSESVVAEVSEQSQESIQELASKLRDALVARKAPFRSIDVDQIVLGPTVVQVPFSVPVGAKLSQVTNQEDDIARDLGVQSVRISNWAGHPGFAVAELPRKDRRIPDVETLKEHWVPTDYPSVALGSQVDFTPFRVPLDELPHLLVAGTTGSGKSIFLRSILWQLTNLYRPEDIDLVIIDAKGMADYLDFASAPHIKSSSDFHSGVAGAIELMEEIVSKRLAERTAEFRKYATDALKRSPSEQISNLKQLLEDARQRSEVSPIRPLVVVIDEFAELVLGSSDRKKFEAAVTRFVGTARAVGGHLIAATQRPSIDVVTGVMKGNFARVGLRVQQAVDSRVVLDEGGAETLLGRGDLLFKSGNVGLVRLQGYSAIGPYAFG